MSFLWSILATLKTQLQDAIGRFSANPVLVPVGAGTTTLFTITLVSGLTYTCHTHAVIRENVTGTPYVHDSIKMWSVSDAGVVTETALQTLSAPSNLVTTVTAANLVTIVCAQNATNTRQANCYVEVHSHTGAVAVVTGA